MRHHLKCLPGPRECLTKVEAVVGVVEVVGEEEEVEGEVGEEGVMAALNVVSKDTSPKNAPKVELGAIKSTGFMLGIRVKAVTKVVVDREGEVAGTREEVEGFKVLAGLVEGVLVDTEVVEAVRVEEVTAEVAMVDKDMEEVAMVDKDMEEMGMVDKDMDEVVKVEEVMEVVEEATVEEGDEGVIESSIYLTPV